MQRPSLLALLPTLALCACTSTRATPAELDEGGAGVPIEASLDLASSAFRPAPPSRAIAAESPEHAAVLALLRDPAYAQRFAESWLSETDLEPRVGALEKEAYQEILRTLSNEQGTEEANLEAALQLLAAQRGPDASAIFDFTEGNLRFQVEELEPAVEAYRAAVLKHPRFRRAWGNLGLASARNGDFAGTIEALSRVVALGGADASTYGLLGIAHTRQLDHLAGESAFRMATLLDPAAREWRMGLTECLFKQERWADAVALCEQQLRADPERSELWLLQANAHARMGQPRKAAENLELLHGMGKGTADSFNLLGDIYVNERLFDLAREGYRHALELAPEAGASRAVRAARDLAARGALEESRKLIERIEALAGGALDDEQRMQILELQARIAAASGATEEQLRILERIVEIDPLDAEALLLLAHHWGREGDPDRAILYYDRAAGMAEHEAEAARGKAQVLVRQGRYAEALPLLRKAQTLDPRDSVQDFLEQVERFATSR
jgi:tetratricopeptide (TPR) repeat protein